MALITCNECKNQISNSAKACPQCGAKVRKPSLIRKIGLGFLALTIFGMVMSALFGETGSTSTSASPANSDKAKLPTLVEMTMGCEVEWELIHKSKLNDPDSLDWDYKNAELGMYQKKSVVMVPYRAKNGFNATSLQQAICQIDPTTGKIKAVLK